MENVTEKRASTLSLSLIWFGAGVSIAEIVTGTFLAPLGWTKGLQAILLGHLIGGILMGLVAWIGATTRKSSMRAVMRSFGNKGALFFSILNVIQLIGWTAIMIAQGAQSTQVVAGFDVRIWVGLIGLLIVLWIWLGPSNIAPLSNVVVLGLFLLTVVLSVTIFGKGVQEGVVSDALSFGLGVEMAISMPLSWLPVVADYTSDAKKPLQATIWSTLAYSFASTWMFVIGLGAALITGESDIAKIMLQAGLGIVAILILIFSTVTTTFLDAYSAGVSAETLSSKIRIRPFAIGVTLLSVVLVWVMDVTQFQDFLFLIGSVFAPMAAIQIADFYLLRANHETKPIAWINAIVWVIGFGVYRWLLKLETPLGVTFPAIVIVMVLSVVIHKVLDRTKWGKA